MDSAVTVDTRLVSHGRAAATVAFFAQGFVFAVVLTHLGAFKDRWDVGDLTITVIMFAVAVLAAVGSALAAWCASHWGSAGGLRIGLVAIAAGVLIVALAPSFAVFCAGLGVYGLGLGCVDATTNMQAVACEALQGRSILTSFHGAWSAGGILGALETSGTAGLGWSLGASLGPVAIVPVIAALTPLLPSGGSVAGVPVPAGGSVAGASVPAGGSVAGASVPAGGSASGDRVIPWRPLIVLGIAIVLFYIADSATQSWSTIYLHDVLGAVDSVAPFGYAAYQATSLVSRLAGDHVVRRIGAVTVVRLAAVVGGVGLLAAVMAPVPWLAILGFGVLGVGIAVVAPLTFAAAGRLAAVDHAGHRIADAAVRRARADAIIARVNQFNYLGFVLGGVLTGLVASGSSMREGFVVPLVGIVLIVPIARAFAGRHHVREPSESSQNGVQS